MAVLLFIDVDSADDLDALHDQSLRHIHCMITAQEVVDEHAGWTGVERTESNLNPSATLALAPVESPIR